MTRKYETQGPDGAPVEIPADLLEKIADDVRAFDRAESPEGRTAFSLKKIALELPRIREAVRYRHGDFEMAEFQKTALAVQVADLCGYTSDAIRRTPRVQRMLQWLGVEE